MKSKIHIFITGLPGVGKTTFIINLANELKDLSMAGFYTAEIREGGIRKGFEVFLNALGLAQSKADVLLIDEIGKMECHSSRFRQLISSLLDADKPLVATISLRSDGFISEIKRRPDVQVLELTTAKRESLVTEVADSVRSLMESKI